MAFTSADLAAIDRAISSGASKVRFDSGREMTWRTMDELLRARAFVAGEIQNGDPTQQVGGVTYAEYDRR